MNRNIYQLLLGKFALVLLLLVGSATSALANDFRLFADTPQLMPGETKEVTVYLSSDFNIRDLQVSVSVNSAGEITDFQSVLPYTRQFACNRTSSNTVKLVSASISGDIIPAGDSIPFFKFNVTNTDGSQYTYVESYAIASDERAKTWESTSGYYFDIFRTKMWSNEARVMKDYVNEVPLYITAAEDIRDLQFDITMPWGTKLEGIDSNLPDYSPIVKKMGEYQYRVIYASLTGNLISSKKTEQLMTLKVSSAQSYGFDSFVVSNIIASNNDASTIRLQEFMGNMIYMSEAKMGDIVFDINNGAEFDASNLYGFNFYVEGYEGLSNEWCAKYFFGNILCDNEIVSTFSVYTQNRGWAWNSVYLDEDLFKPGKKYTIHINHAKFGSYMDGGEECWEFDKDVDYSVWFTTIPEYELIYNVKKGWNWLSFNLNSPYLYNAGEFLNKVSPFVTYAASQTQSMTYSANYDEWIGWMDLTPSKGYKLYAIQDIVLPVTGKRLDYEYNYIGIQPGWNWIGYTPMVASDVNYAFSRISACEGDIIKGQDGFATYSEGEQKWIGQLTMVPGSAYLYYSNKSHYDTYVYGPRNASNDIITDTEEARDSIDQTNRTWKVAARRGESSVFNYDPYQYRDNMAVIAKLQDDEQGRYQIAAFAGDECRGVAQAAEGYQMLTVHGEKRAETIRLYILDTLTGDIFMANETLSFNGSSIGTLKAPVMLSIGAPMGNETDGIHSTLMADETDVYNLQGVKATNIKSKGLYIKGGKKMLVK